MPSHSPMLARKSSVTQPPLTGTVGSASAAAGVVSLPAATASSNVVSRSSRDVPPGHSGRSRPTVATFPALSH